MKNKNQFYNLLPIIKLLLENIKHIILFSVLSLAIGVYYSMTREDIYTSSTRLVSKLSNEKNANTSLQNIASLAGINLDLNNDNLINEDFYPIIFETIELKKSFIDIKIDDDYYLRDYILENNKSSFNILSLIKKVFNFFRSFHINEIDNKEEIKIISTDIFKITDDDFKIIKGLNNIINIEIDNENSSFILTCNMNNKNYVANVLSKVKMILQEKIISINIDKLIDEKIYIESLLNEKKIEFNKIQNKLSEFRDKNINLSTEKIKNELNNLQSEYNLIFNIYSELLLKYENKKLEIKRNTPIFTALEPITIPNERSYPNKVKLTIFITFIFTILFTVIYLFISLSNRKKLIKIFNDLM